MDPPSGTGVPCERHVHHPVLSQFDWDAARRNGGRGIPELVRRFEEYERECATPSLTSRNGQEAEPGESRDAPEAEPLVPALAATLKKGPTANPTQIYQEVVATKNHLLVGTSVPVSKRRHKLSVA